jgi:menaquinone-dependent protoporphyrinogen oxidase
VDCKPARDVGPLTGYDAVVVGGPLYMFKWHKDARRFLSRHHDALWACPVAIFAVGPTEDTEENWQGAREHLGKALAQFGWLAPVATSVFGGKFDPAALRFPFNALPAMKSMPVSDLRDWEAIRGWADELALTLRAPTP